MSPDFREHVQHLLDVGDDAIPFIFKIDGVEPTVLKTAEEGRRFRMAFALTLALKGVADAMKDLPPADDVLAADAAPKPEPIDEFIASRPEIFADAHAAARTILDEFDVDDEVEEGEPSPEEKTAQIVQMAMDAAVRLDRASRLSPPADDFLDRARQLANTQREALHEKLAQQSPPPADDETRLFFERVAECVKEYKGEGFWRSCSGCVEGVDGCVSTKDYPFSEAFGCQLGGGCSDCGGIGAIWDTTDYDAMARDILAADEARQSPPLNMGEGQFPPSRCTAFEDCRHDGSCHDPESCGAEGPNDPEALATPSLPEGMLVGAMKRIKHNVDHDCGNGGSVICDATDLRTILDALATSPSSALNGDGK